MLSRVYSWSCICILITFLSYSAVHCEEACTFIDYIEKDGDGLSCSNSKVCKNGGKPFTISYIETPPFTFDTLNDLGLYEINYLLRVCCGGCIKPPKQTWFDSIDDVTMKEIRSSDFVYPIMARSSATKLYGMHYIPVHKLSKVLYVTKFKDDTQLIRKIFNLYPLILVALLFALVSGFIAWIVETWANREEFPRPFLIGWFEGFWWSFVSMTTVGYGDKSPRSVPARLFSVIWILIGLIVCAILTGELTGQIVQANSPTPEEMAGKNVGVMHFRDYEAYVVAQKGGRVKRSNNYDPIADFVELTRMLKNGTVDGLAVEYETFFHVGYSMKEAGGHENDLRQFLESKITTTENTYKGETFSFGILVKNENVYNYFKDYVIEASARNQYFFSLQNNEQKEIWNERNKKLFSVGNSLLFSSDSVYFKQTMTAVGIMFAFIFIFGIFFEVQRKKNLFKPCGTIDGSTG